MVNFTIWTVINEKSSQIQNDDQKYPKINTFDTSYKDSLMRRAENICE